MINYLFNKYKDKYTILNQGSNNLYVRLVPNDNPTNVKAVELIPGKSVTLGTLSDGNYTFVYSENPNALNKSYTITISDVVKEFSSYLILQTKIIHDLTASICGKDCLCMPCSKDQSADFQTLFNQLLTYQYLIRPQVDDVCASTCGFDGFLLQAIALNKSKLLNDANAQLCNTAYGKGNKSDSQFRFLIGLYYLAFYFAEYNQANDDDERSFVNRKFNFVETSRCLNNNCISVNDIRNIYQDNNVMCNTAPTVDNVIKSFNDPDPGLEQRTYTFTRLDFTTNFADLEGDQPKLVKILSDTFNGDLLYNNQVINGQDFVFDIANVGLLKYRYTIPAIDTQLFDKIFFKISDDNINSKYSEMATITINTSAYVNLKPTAVGDNSFTIGNRSTKVFTVADFTSTTTPAYQDPENDAPDKLRIDSLPASGQLLLANAPVTIGQVINMSQIAAGQLKYVAPDQNPTAASNFDFSIADAGSGQFSS